MDNDEGAARRYQFEEAARRYAKAETKRGEVEQKRKAADSAVVDTREQIVARAGRLLQSGEVPAQAVIELGKANPLGELASLERIIGAASQLQAVSFLPRGARAAATVARISLSHNGREIPQGTGSLVSPRLLLTNNHVLPDAETARAGVVEFRAEADIENTPAKSIRFRLDPDAFFVTDKHLDFTLVLVASGPDGVTPGATVGGWNRLIRQQGKIVVGESMNIAGHPMGRLKEISIRDNRLDLQLPEFLHYSTDTEPGNSGSPVFNDQWEVVALHHSGVPRTDEQDQVLRKDGQVWRPGDGDDAIDWIANEGVRVSAILEHLAGVQLSPAKRELLAELGPGSGLDTGSSAVVAAPPPAPVVPERVRVVEAITRGVKARPTAFGGTRSLLFLHGRGQEGRNPDDLRRSWTAGLNEGLTLAGLGPIDPADVYFPFYGDRLVESLAAQESIVAGDGETGGLYEQIVAEAAAQAGMPTDEDMEPAIAEGLRGFGTGLLSKVQGQLGWLAARSGLDDVIIARIFKDVAAYLDREQTRRSVLDTVLETVPASGQLVLVSHSLGTVVAMDLLTKLPSELNVTMLITAGSPLGLDAVYKKLLVGGPNRPSGTVDWLNTWYAGDPVAMDAHCVGCGACR